MPIRVSCTCGKTYQVPETRVGQRFRCPACGAALTVAGPGAGAPRPGAAAPGRQDKPPSSGELELVRPSAGTCPGCGAQMAYGAVFCTACGYDLRTGARAGQSAVPGAGATPSQPAAPAGSAPAAGAGQDGAAEAEERPPNILSVLVECVRRPSVMADIGAGGISGAAILAQIAGAFVLLSFLSGVVVAVASKQAEVSPLKAGLDKLAGDAGSLVSLTVAFYLLAQVTRPNAKFMDLLTGLAFVRVVGAIIGIAFALLAMGVVAVVPMGVGVATIIWVGMLVVMAILHIYFLMGVFDMGCWLSAMLGVLAGYLANFLSGWGAALMGKLAGQ